MNILSQVVNKISLIKQIPLFSKLSWFDLHKVAIECEIVHYRLGEIIYRAGDPPDAFYCLISGRIRAFNYPDDSEHAVSEQLYRGQYFGIISLLTGENHSLTMDVLNDSVVLRIEQDHFQRLINQIPSLGIDLSHNLSRRVNRREKEQKTIFESTILSAYGSVSGSGSSTYAAHLAWSLKEETGRRVVLVNIAQDQYRQSQRADQLLGIQWRAEPSMMTDFLNRFHEFRQKSDSSLDKVHTLSLTFKAAEGSLSGRISELVSLLANDYHFVIVDLPNAMDEIVRESLIQSDYVHLITGHSEKELKKTKDIISDLRESWKTNFLHEKIKVFVQPNTEAVLMSHNRINHLLGFEMECVLPRIEAKSHLRKIESDNFLFLRAEQQSPYAKTVRKIARETGGVLVGLALGSGAALGLSHIGVLEVLEDNDIPIDVIIGSSIGAVIGGLWASGMKARQIEKAAKEFSTWQKCLKLIDPIFSKAGLMAGRGINRWLKSKIGEKTFYDTQIPFKAVAFDLTKMEDIAIDEGTMVEAIQKSIAIPGIIKPITAKERLFIDGGIINPLPTNFLSALGIKKIIAVNVLQSPGDFQTIYEKFCADEQKALERRFLSAPISYLGIRLRRLALRVFSPNISSILVRSFQASEYTLAEESAKAADVLIHPDLTEVNWLELYQVDRIIQKGREAAQRQLENIKNLLQ